MAKEMKIEYLYPNINNEKKYKWLGNANFRQGILDYDIIQYSLEEYLKMTDQENNRYIDSFGKDITNQENQKNYQIWKEHGQKIWNLSPTIIKWNQEIVHALANYLSKNPLYLPCFIEHNTADIIGHFIGQPFLLYDSQKTSSKYAPKLWENRKINREQYLTNNFEAKYNLSLLLAVLDELLDLGVNLEEYQFGNFDKNNTYNKLKKASPWNESLLKSLKEEDYIREDGYHFTQEELKNILSYKNLREFLDKVIELVETECYMEFIEEAITMDPKHIEPFKGYSKMSMSYYKETGVKEVENLCREMQEKMRKVSEKTESIWIQRRYEKLKKELESYILEEDYIKLLPEPENLYDIFHSDKGKIKKSSEEQKETSSSEENLKKQITVLEEKLEKAESEVEELKQQLQRYIKEGGENPLKQGMDIPKEQLVSIISGLDAKTWQEKLRKNRLLGFLTGFVAGVTIMSLALFPWNLNKGKSRTHIVALEGQEKLQSPEQTEAEEQKEETFKIPESLYDRMANLKPEKPMNPEVIAETMLEIVRGNYGNGEERVERLTEAGYDYDYIQSLVNEAIYGEVPTEDYKKLVK